MPVVVDCQPATESQQASPSRHQNDASVTLDPDTNTVNGFHDPVFSCSAAACVLDPNILSLHSAFDEFLAEIDFRRRYVSHCSMLPWCKFSAVLQDVVSLLAAYFYLNQRVRA